MQIPTLSVESCFHSHNYITNLAPDATAPSGRSGVLLVGDAPWQASIRLRKHLISEWFLQLTSHSPVHFVPSGLFTMSATTSEKDLLSIKRQDSDTITDSKSCAAKATYEGGSEAWLTVLGSFLVYYASFGLINSFGYFSNYYERNFLHETPVSTIAFIGTLQILLMYLVGTVSGALCDSYGVKVTGM